MKYLEHYTSKDMVRTGDGCLSGCLIAIIVLCVIVVFLNQGCSTCPPCQPKVEIVEVKVPVYACPKPPELLPLSLSEYPTVPGVGATDSEMKAWYAAMVATLHARDSIRDNYIQYLIDLLEEYRTDTDGNSD